MIVSSAAYYEAMSEPPKNATDYAENLRADDSPCLDGRAAGCIVCAQVQALGSTLANMKPVVHALRGWSLHTPRRLRLLTIDSIKARSRIQLRERLKL